MSLNHEALKQTRAGGGDRSGRGWKPKDGANRVRVLPPHSKYLLDWDSMKDIAIMYRIHYFKIEGRKPTPVSRCLRELSTARDACPACDAYWAHKDSADPGLKKMAQDVRNSQVFLMNMLDLGNLQAGVQHWAANFTCWDKILEVAANIAWGNVLDPANGVDFTVNMVDGKKTKTGRNQYGAVPDPTRTNIMPVLEAFPNWQATLDALVEEITEPVTVDEMRVLLGDVGFPEFARYVRPATPGAAPGAATVTPAVAGAVIPAGAPVVVPAPVSVPPPIGVALTTAAPAPVAPSTTPTPAPAPVVVQAAPAAPVGVHYDPGPTYEPKVPDGERPADAPRCFGDFDPKRHQCTPCPKLVPCQMRVLKIPAATA